MTLRLSPLDTMTPKTRKMEQETIYGQVVSKANNYQVGSDGHGRRYIIKSDAIREYERSFMEQCRIYKDRNINCHFTLYVAVYESSMRFDLDNSLKTLLDCLQMVKAITDDNLCRKIVAEKHIDKYRPRVVFGIVPQQLTLGF